MKQELENVHSTMVRFIIVDNTGQAKVVYGFTFHYG